MNIAKFTVDNKKCIGCGNCSKVCPGGLISISQGGKAEIADIFE